MSGQAAHPPPRSPAPPLGADPALLEALILASPDVVVAVDDDGKIVAASPAVEPVFGYRAIELVGQPVEVLVPEHLRAAHVGDRTEFLVTPRPRPMGAGLHLEGRRRDGSTFPIDVALVPVLLDGRRWVGAFVRDVTERRRGEVLLEYANEVNQRLISESAGLSATGSDILALVANRARILVGAATAWVVVQSPSGELVVAAADGSGARSLVGTELSAHESLAGRAMAERATQMVDDMASNSAVLAPARTLGLGPGMYLPLADDVVLGTLVLAREAGGQPFTRADAAVAELFASAAALALSLGRARQEVEELRFASEHDRIARDLHDTVIQRLFALGMGLQGVTRMVSGPAAERIDSAVDALDEIIREIRDTIFDLQARRDRPSLRTQLRDVAAEAEEQLGFAPALGLRGPLDTSVTDLVATHLLAVVRESLSNVARHAGATKVEVMIVASSDGVTVTVADDGSGAAEPTGSGHGLANIASRAEELGGHFHIGPGPLGGAIVEWRVPV